jgi:hypothetical protein
MAAYEKTSVVNHSIKPSINLVGREIPELAHDCLIQELTVCWLSRFARAKGEVKIINFKR